jgi:hypothetical protein
MTRIELPQDEDIYLRSHTSGAFALRYASVRSGESRDSDQPGQDFVSFAAGEGYLTFAVCDGVGQSFYGDLAARFLGRHLLGWLDDDGESLPDIERLAEELTAFLEALTNEATREVASVVISPDLPELLREVLEEKREWGSETTFVCGRIDLPRDDLPEGRLLLCWLGDSRLRLGKRNTWGRQIVEVTDESPDRWSSARGLVKGTPRLTLQPLVPEGLTNVGNVLVYTDGLKLLDKHTIPLGGKDLDDLIVEASSSLQGDDASVLEIEIGLRQVKTDGGAGV